MIVLAQAMFEDGHGIQWTWRGGLSESRLRFVNFINGIYFVTIESTRGRKTL